jgi:hypothetical protein
MAYCIKRSNTSRTFCDAADTLDRSHALHTWTARAVFEGCHRKDFRALMREVTTSICLPRICKKNKLFCNVVQTYVLGGKTGNMTLTCSFIA